MLEEDMIHNYLKTVGYEWLDLDISGGHRFYSKERDKTILVIVEEVEE